MRDEGQLATLIEEIRTSSAKVQRGRLSQMRQSLELDELYYEQKDNQAGLARTARCLALIDARLAELGQAADGA